MSSAAAIRGCVRHSSSAAALSVRCLLLLGVFAAGCSDSGSSPKGSDLDADGFTTEQGDCDDADVNEFPNQTWYADLDADGFGDDASQVFGCERPTPTSVFVGGDCADGDATRHPNAVELCDGVDQNCNALIDDGVAGGMTFHADADGDGYGSPTVTMTACVAPAGYVTTTGDCDDSNAAFHPGATEDDCGDSNDYNCDGSVGTVDADGDTYAACSDCDDSNAAINPGATEVCDADATDEDCDGNADDADTAVTGGSDWYPDADGDGYGDADATAIAACEQPDDAVADHTDCDDAVAAVHPGAVEICDDADVDEDCSGAADGEDPNATGSSVWYADADGDTYGDTADTGTTACDPPEGTVDNNDDCDDDATTGAAINPGAAEVCDAADVDEDCDATSDDDDSSVTGQLQYYPDADSDTYGDAAATPTSACDPPGGLILDHTDCNDAAAAVHPGATEVCDAANVDEDCDTLADDADSSADPAGKVLRYDDFDGDGYGDPTDSALWCDPPLDDVANDDDCNDNLATISPAMAEVCDALDVDEDCDGLADDADPGVTQRVSWYQDGDGDGYGDAADASPVLACTAPADSADNNGDCDDSDPAFHPGATETCSGTDDLNCDGSIGLADADNDGSPACEDCDDADPARSPELSEVCDAADVDEDCDGNADDADTGIASRPTWYADLDGDGYGDDDDTGTVSCEQAQDTVAVKGDCDDGLAAVNPAGTEVCDAAGAVDEDCDGNIDDGDSNVDPATFSDWYLDADGDGYGSDSDAARAACEPFANEVDNDDDCNDAAVGGAAVHPGASEITGDAVDQDCDGAELCFLDADEDGYRPNATATKASADTDCDDAGEALATDPTTDCADADAAIHPGASEITGDAVDQDCDGAELCFLDLDDDGHRPDDTATKASTDSDCADAGEALGTEPTDDCDDSKATVYPGATETVGDGVDQDCDAVDSCYTDADNDGYGTTVVIAGLTLSCVTDANRANNDDDCEDTQVYVYPGAKELCDDQRNNCTTTASWTRAKENGVVSTEVDGVWTNVQDPYAVTPVTIFTTAPYALPATGTVWVCPGSYTTRVTSAGTATLSSRDGTIAAAALTTLDANGTGSVARVTAGELTIRGLTLTGGSGTNVSGLRGGGVYVSGGDLTVEESIFIDNSAARGGAIDTNADSDIIISDSRFGGTTTTEGNTATTAGGAISINHLSATLTMSGTTLQNNSSTQSGGALSLGTGQPVSLVDCELLDNAAFVGGGGIFATGAVALGLTDTDFDGNTAITGGAGIWVEGTASVLAACPTTSTVGFTANASTFGGGAIHIVGTGAFRNDTTHPCFMGTSALSADNNTAFFLGNDVNVSAGDTDTADYNGTTAFLCNTVAGCAP
jgi:hypothetical protein